MDERWIKRLPLSVETSDTHFFAGETGQLGSEKRGAQAPKAFGARDDRDVRLLVSHTAQRLPPLVDGPVPPSSS